MKKNNVLETIGKTPLVKINKLTSIHDATIYAKLEYFNPGSSIKDRIALAMVDDAEKKGLLKPDSTIIEPTSGNTGIGLAIVAAVKGYKIILTMPETMSIERQKLLKFLGAEIILTDGAKGMAGSVEKARQLAMENGYFMPQQFENFVNPEIHKKTTSQEIISDMGDENLNYFIAGVGTGGTISGNGEILKKHYPQIKIIAVEPIDSPVLSGGIAGPHKIQGIGAGFIPKIYNSEVVDEIIKIKSVDALNASKLLAKKEGILAGISAGAAMHAALELSRGKKGKNNVVILPDTAERYLSTELFDNIGGEENV